MCPWIRRVYTLEYLRYSLDKSCNACHPNQPNDIPMTLVGGVGD